jgi:hypothetical protein
VLLYNEHGMVCQRNTPSDNDLLNLSFWRHDHVDSTSCSRCPGAGCACPDLLGQVRGYRPPVLAWFIGRRHPEPQGDRRRPRRRYCYRGGFYGGSRGGFYGGSRGGFYGGYRGAYYGGYRGLYYGGYRGLYYPRYYSRYLYPGFYGYYPSYYGYYPSVYYSYPIYTYPVVAYSYPTTLTTVIPTMPSAQPTLSTSPRPQAESPATPGTFPYDGGPRAPVPVPRGEETMTQVPKRPMLLEDLAVSTSAGVGKWNYPAYGEKPTRTPSYSVQPTVIAGGLR